MDLGCGDGSFVRFLRESGYDNVLGVDGSEEQVSAAKENGIDRVARADLKEFLENRAGEFDLIVARDVLEHFTKDEVLEVCDVVLRALKPAGKFMVQVPNGEALFCGRARYGDFTHELSFTQTSLRQVLLEAGFECFTASQMGPVPTGPRPMIRWLIWSFVNLILRLCLLAETGSGKAIFTQNLLATASKPQ